MMMDRILFPLALILLAATASRSATPQISDSEKLDSLMQISKEIRMEVRKINPLLDKRYGVEINPAFPLLAAGDGIALTGGLQVFHWDRRAEISFPFQIFKEGSNGLFTQDAHYRRFLGPTQGGAYLSAFARYSYIATDIFSWSPENGNTSTYFTDHRAGVGFGIGYRLYSRKGLYWGMSLNLGRNLIAQDQDGFPEADIFIDFGKTIFDVEFFKFGFSL